MLASIVSMLVSSSVRVVFSSWKVSAPTLSKVQLKHFWQKIVNLRLSHSASPVETLDQ